MLLKLIRVLVPVRQFLLAVQVMDTLLTLYQILVVRKIVNQESDFLEV